MKRRIEFRLKTIILWVLWPALLLLTVLMAQLVYSALYSTILSGFEKKLKSVGCATASFVRGEQHDLLLDMRQATGFAVAEQQGLLFASYSTAPLLDIYDVKKGSLVKRSRIKYGELGDLAYDSSKNKLYGLSSSPSELVVLEYAAGKGKALYRFKSGCSGLTYRPDTRRLYTVMKGKLLYFSVDNPAQQQVVGPVPMKSVTGLSWLAAEKQLWAIDVLSSSLVRLDPATGKELSRIKLNSGTAKSGHPLPPFSMPAWGLAFDRHNNRFVTGTPVSMAGLDRKTGEMQRITVVNDKWKSARDYYQELVQPFYRIKEQLNLSFLITTTLVNNFRNIFYVLDASRVDDHSFIGYVDPTESERATSDVIIKGKVFLSDIKFWEDWGLMKSSYVPILNEQGKPRAMVTTDINIDIIRNKTRSAFNRVMLGGLISILIGMIAAFYIARHIVKPIVSLKNFALQVAAGNYGAHSHIADPKELEELSVSFNAMSSTLKNTLDDLEHANQRLEANRQHSQLIQHLLSEADSTVSSTALLAVERRSGRAEDPAVSGWSEKSGKFLVWFGAQKDSSLQSARKKRDLHLLTGIWLENGYTAEQIHRRLCAVGADQTVEFSPADGKLLYYGDPPLVCWIKQNGKSGLARLTLASGEELQLESGGIAVVSEFLQQEKIDTVLDAGVISGQAVEILHKVHNRFPESASRTISAVMVRSL